MPYFTTETAVRLKFHWHDTTLAPSELIQAAIHDAHTELIRRLDPRFNVEPPEDGLALGATALAGAHVARSLAAQEAVAQKRVTVGGQRIEEGARFTSLTLLADSAETLAWRCLEPYLNDQPGAAGIQTTAAQPVLGEE